MTLKEPTTPFEPEKPIVPDGWDVLPFQQAVTVVSDQGKRVKQSTYLETGKIPVIDQGQDYSGGFIDDEAMAYDGELPVILFGDHTRSIKYVDKRFAVGAEGIKILKPANDYNPKFFYYLLRSLQIPSRGYSRHFQFLKKFYLPIAPPDDQKLIVAEIEKQFSRLDEAVANLMRVKANLKRYKAAALKAAVEGRIVETEAELARRGGRGYETGTQLLQRILETRRTQWKGKGTYKEPTTPDTTDPHELPKGWAWASIDQLAAPEPNAITDGPFGSNLKTVHYQVTGPRVIRLQNIKDGEFADEYAHISEEHFARLRKHEILSGDLVIASLGDNPPRACIIPPFVGRAIVKADCIRFKPHLALVSAYLNVALNCQPTRQRVKSVIHGIGRPRLTLGEIRQIALPIPPEIEQRRIVAEVDHRFSLAREVEAQIDANLRRAESLRQSVLAKAFKGTLLQLNG
jgi:type I restriction enzyme S subunit